MTEHDSPLSVIRRSLFFRVSIVLIMTIGFLFVISPSIPWGDDEFIVYSSLFCGVRPYIGGENGCAAYALRLPGQLGEIMGFLPLPIVRIRWCRTGLDIPARAEAPSFDVYRTVSCSCRAGNSKRARRFKFQA